MNKSIRDYNNDWLPNANFKQSPSWLVAAHAASYPHVHEWDQTQILGRGFREPNTPSTYFVAHEVRGPNVYAPRARALVDPFNTSSPKVEMFLSPFIKKNPVPVKF